MAMASPSVCVCVRNLMSKIIVKKLDNAVSNKIVMSKNLGILKRRKHLVNLHQAFLIEIEARGEKEIQHLQSIW